MGNLVGSRTGVAKRCLGRSIAPAAWFLLRNASFREAGTLLRLSRRTLVSAIDASCRVVSESGPSEIATGSPTDNDSSHARSRSGASHHIRCDPRYHVVGAGLRLVGHCGMATAV